MKTPDPILSVSADTWLKYERDKHALEVAQQNCLESWLAVQREAYAAAECADAGASAETET